MNISADFPIGLSMVEARALIENYCAAIVPTIQQVPLGQAYGRVLATDITAPSDVPRFANSAMDGYALRGVDLPQQGKRAFRMIDVALAGGDRPLTIGEGECIRITTGAALPIGADTVIIKERVHCADNLVWIDSNQRADANVRPAGEDYRAGEKALLQGTRLGAAQLGVLASFGFTQVPVTRRLRVVLLTTGNELVTPGVTLSFGQIYDSNSYSLGALIQAYGVESLRHEQVGDDPIRLKNALEQAATQADIVLSSGGVSAGEADFLPQLLQQIGKVHLWKVKIKPGMPFLFAQVQSALVFALPGNPVSSIATFLTLVRPALDVLSGCHQIGIASWRARLAAAIHKSHDRAEFQRATLRCDEQGTLWAQALAQQGSGMLRSVAEANVLIAIPEQACELAMGSVVEVLPLSCVENIQ